MAEEFGPKIADFVDACFGQVAKEYAGDNWQFVTLTQKVMKRERTLQRIRERGTEPSSLIPMKTARFLENLHDLDSQRLRLDWLTTRPQSDIEGLEEADRGQYALLIHDDVFIHGLALVDKAGVVAGTAISHFAENLQSTKSETKRRYRALFKALRQGIAPIRDPMLHGQGRGGVDRPGPSILTDGLWWEWVLATRAWPPHHGHELVFGKAADSLGEWAAALREPAAGTANEVGDILAALKSELGL